MSDCSSHVGGAARGLTGLFVFVRGLVSCPLRFDNFLRRLVDDLRFRLFRHQLQRPAEPPHYDPCMVAYHSLCSSVWNEQHLRGTDPPVAHETGPPTRSLTQTPVSARQLS